MNTEKRKEYIYSNEAGETTLTVYTIFPGIQVIYNSVHTDSFDLDLSSCNGNFVTTQHRPNHLLIRSCDSDSSGQKSHCEAIFHGFLPRNCEGTEQLRNFIEIHHCTEGRIEQEFEQDFFYLMPGDLSIAKRNQAIHTYHFPLQHYHGVTIAINTDIAPKCFSAFLEDVTVQPARVADRLCGEKNCCILRGNSTIEHIFSELYTIREEQKTGYLKIKVLELLFVLNMIDLPENAATGVTLPRKQVQLAKSVAEYLSGHLDKHITIPELSKRFGVSDTHLKSAFKSVYGVPVFSYVRIQKMYGAARLLIHTDRSISDISMEFGYNNESKFSAAFREIMGNTPRDYRRQHSKMNIM